MRKNVLLIIMLVFLIPVPTLMAATITIDYATLTRTIRGVNSIGWAPGDRILINAELDRDEFNDAGGAANTTMIATNDSSSNKELNYHDFFGTPMFSRTRTYSSDIADPWELFVTNGGDVVSKTTNTLENVDTIPFVRNVQLQGAGLEPTVKWTIDGDVTNKRVQVFLHDAEGNRFWWSGGSVPATTTSVTIPEGELEDGKKYTARIKVFEMDPATNQPLSQTETFIDFTPLKNGSPEAVFMPVVGADTNPDDDLGASAYFDVDVTADTPIFIDPFIAVGYDYQIGWGDPLFKSIVLPSLGDDTYQLWLRAGSDWVFETDISAGIEYIFNSGNGTDYFRILGIEESLGIDPEDMTAFITQLTFTGSGAFTGSMTPITKWVDPVPEPATMLLFGLGILGLARVSRNNFN